MNVVKVPHFLKDAGFMSCRKALSDDDKREGTQSCSGPKPLVYEEIGLLGGRPTFLGGAGLATLNEAGKKIVEEAVINLTLGGA